MDRRGQSYTGVLRIFRRFGREPRYGVYVHPK